MYLESDQQLYKYKNSIRVILRRMCQMDAEWCNNNRLNNDNKSPIESLPVNNSQ